MNESRMPEPTTECHLPLRLYEGYRAFRAGRLPTEQSRYRELAERGQAPETMVVGCCDSRVSPEVIFDARPGELFVVRNVANLVPPYSPDGLYHGVSAALEYGVAVLRVKHLVVLGHARCGGIQAFASNAPSGDFIGKWISLLAPAAASIQSERDEQRLSQAARAGVAQAVTRQSQDISVRPRRPRTQRAGVVRRLLRCRDWRAVGAGAGVGPVRRRAQRLSR